MNEFYHDLGVNLREAMFKEKEIWLDDENRKRQLDKQQQTTKAPFSDFSGCPLSAKPIGFWSILIRWLNITIL